MLDFSLMTIHRMDFLYMNHSQAYTSQIVVMAMLALAIGSDTISSQERREAIIDGLIELPSMFKTLNFSRPSC